MVKAGQSRRFRAPGLGGRMWRYRYLYLLILPAFVLVFIFSYMPMYGIVLAFKKFAYNKSFLDLASVGFGNYTYLFKQADFIRAFWNTVVIGFGKLFIGFFPPIILALMLNEVRCLRYKKVVQSVLYLPYFLSWVIIAGILYSLLSGTAGVYGKLAMQMGVKPLRILGNPKYYRTILYLSEIWKTAGWGTIIYLAAIAGVNPELYESARLDGASRIQQIWHITVPSIKYTILILLILNCGGIMDAGFDQIFNTYNTSVYVVGDIIDTYVYRLGIRSAKYDVSAAAGLLKSVINCAMLVIANTAVKWFGGESFY